MPIFIISPLGRESRLTLPRGVRVQGVQRPDHPTVDISRQIVIGFAQIPGKNGSKGEKKARTRLFDRLASGADVADCARGYFDKD